MRPYLISLLVGIGVGILYGLIKVRSPAPPAIALVGLLGILAGEQAVPIVRAWWEARNSPTPAQSPARPQAATDKDQNDAPS